MAIVAFDETIFQTSAPDESIIEGAEMRIRFTPPDIATLRAKPVEDLTDTEAEVIAAFDRLGV